MNYMTLVSKKFFLHSLPWKCQFDLLHLSHLMTKPTKWSVRPGKTQISLGIRPVWSESSLSAWRKLGSLATHWAHSEDSDQTGQMPRLIWGFTGHTVVLLVLSWGSSSVEDTRFKLSMNETQWMKVRGRVVSNKSFNKAFAMLSILL